MTAVKIARHAPLQAFRLADIYHLSLVVEIHVDARRLGKIQNLLAQLSARTVVEYIVASAVGRDLDIKSAHLINLPAGRSENHLYVLACGSPVDLLLSGCFGCRFLGCEGTDGLVYDICFGIVFGNNVHIHITELRAGLVSFR